MAVREGTWSMELGDRAPLKIGQLHWSSQAVKCHQTTSAKSGSFERQNRAISRVADMDPPR